MSRQIHVDVLLKGESDLDYRTSNEVVKAVLNDLRPIGTDTIFLSDIKMSDVWKSISLTDVALDIRSIKLAADNNTEITSNSSFIVHSYQLFDNVESDLVDLLEDEEDDDSINKEKSASILELPNEQLDGLWDTLHFDYNIKDKLLSYINTTIKFSTKNIDQRIISWNRIILLHGPPGTGKTSLAKALAHNLSIRLNETYAQGRLVEINAHSLFSKWFSESGKLVQGMFDSINKLAEDDSVFVTLLIDEVESLTAARQASLSGNEPSDALRVVNALLTQIDKLKQRKNVLIIATSNLTNAIDDAFMDRADIKQYIGNPSIKAIEKVLNGCLNELVMKGLIADDDSPVDAISALAKTHEASGRFLRKLPLLAYTHVQEEVPTRREIIESMKVCIEENK